MPKNLFDRFLNIGRPGHTVWHASWKFRCDVCGKFMAMKERRGGLHKHCMKQYEDGLAEAERYREEQDEAYYHMLDVLDTFCGHYGCWAEIDPSMEELCFKHDFPDADDPYVPDYEDNKGVSFTEV